jgi:hypothetical protein
LIFLAVLVHKSGNVVVVAVVAQLEVVQVVVVLVPVVQAVERVCFAQQFFSQESLL